MINFYKYLPVSKEDESWGLYVLNAGCTHIAASEQYPSKVHPAYYHFNWNTGRALKEYQFIYITRGEGIFESESGGTNTVKAGTLIVLFPDERHRYKPSEKTGWDEYWIGIKGTIIDNLVDNGFFTLEHPLRFIGFKENIMALFSQIIDTVKDERTGYQALASGAALHLLGLCHAISKQLMQGSKENEVLADQARLLFRSKIMESFSAQDAAALLQIGYSKFRKVFKEQTGLPPGQYYLQLKLEKAREMLSDPGIPAKTIAYDLGFDNYYHFSKLFKEKTGYNPMEYRKGLLKNSL